MVSRIVGVLLFLCQIAGAQGIYFQAENWEEAVAQAKVENKLIFLDAYTTWCAPCKVMDEYVFTHELGGDLHNTNFINLKMDMEKGIGPLFLSRYDIKSYPAFLYLTWDGTLVHKSIGYQNIEKLVQEGNKALELYRLERALNDRYNDGDRIPDFLYHLTYYRLNKNDEKYRNLIPMYLDTQTDWTKANNLKYIFDFVDDFDSEMFKHMSQNKVAYGEIVGADAFNKKFKEFIAAAMNNNGQPLSLERREEIYHVAYPGVADLMITEYKLDYFMDANDEKKYTETAYYYYKSYAQDDEEGIIRDLPLFEKHLTTSEVVTFVRTWYERIANESNTAASWLKIAQYHLNDKEFDQASELGKKAKKIAKKAKEDQTPYKDFLKQVKRAKKSMA